VIEQGIHSILAENSALAALIGTRIYPGVLPPNPTLPCLSYTVISAPPSTALDGSSGFSTRVQFDCWAARYGDVKAVQQALHDVFDAYAGTLPDGTNVQGAFRAIEMDAFLDVARTYRAMTEYRFIYS
jgi:hypothetical protein